MDTVSTIEEIKKLSVEERILLVEEIWDSIAAEPELLEVPEHQKRELDKRLEAFRKSPEEGTDWDTVRKGLLG